jgi:ATP-binding cassette subfamily B protein
MDYFRFLLPFMRPYKISLFVILLFIIFETVFYSSIAFSFKFIIDNALLGANHNLLIYIFTYLGVGSIAILFISLYRDYLQACVVANILRDMRTHIYEHLECLSMDFFSRSQSGDILLHFSSELASIESTAFSTITLAIQPALSLLTSLTLLTILSWKLTLIVLLAFPIILIGPHKVSSLIVEKSHEEKTLEANLLSHIQESIATQLISKAFGLRQYMTQLFAKINKNMTSVIIRVSFLGSIASRAADTTAMYLQIAVLGIGTYLAYHKSLTIGSLVSFQTIFTSLIYTIAYMTNYIPSLMGGTAGAQRVKKFLNEKPKFVDSPTAIDVSSFSQEIVFHNVDFSYDEKQIQLKNISFNIRKGTSVAFVGSSGSGKTTLLNLIMRLHDPSHGMITLDGIDFRYISQHSLHYLMGYVFQESLLLNTTIRENIRLGKLDATDAEIETAAKTAEIHDAIMSLPEGYESNVGERGGRLSGGQKQRIAIARAMVRSPSILILDEATSALDSATEAAITETLKKIEKHRTNIIVTHRLDTIMHADRIFVLHQGTIYEHGNHAELMAQNGVYKQLWKKQNGFVLNAENDDANITPARLKLIPLFSDLPPELLEKSVKNFRTIIYPEDHIVIEEGDIGDLFYIIVRGKVGIFNASTEGDANHMAILEDGDYFGEIALLKKVLRTATVKTLLPCVFLILRRRDFHTLLTDAPGLQQKIEQLAEKRILNSRP